MSGGIGSGGRGQNQMVIFTIAGELSPAQVAAWNQKITELKRMFGVNLHSLTLSSEHTRSVDLSAYPADDKSK
jgi:hypothetical protein